MTNYSARNYKVYILVSNFRTKNKELDFGDFKIISVRQGTEAAKWREKLGCKDVPRNILIKEFLNYRIKDNDTSGFDEIIDSTEDLLLLFRLHKTGDIMFDNILIEDLENQKSYFNLGN